MFNRLLRTLFHLLIIRPIVFVAIGLTVRGRENLPENGPAIIVANHNSHLDTAVVMSLFPIAQMDRVRPVAAADYFLRSRLMSWFSLEIMGIVPVDRSARERGEDPFDEVNQRLAAGDILILFPEGTRGEPEQMVELKKGISHLIEEHPYVPVTPIFLRGLGKALPKGSWLPVPFFCDVYIGTPLHWQGDREVFMEQLRTAIDSLSRQGHTADWD